MFLRTESFKEFIRFYPIITFLVVLHLFLWITVDFIQIPLFVHLQNWGIGSNIGIDRGEYWRFITPIFFHSGLTHALFNSFALILFGPPLEQMLGKAKFIITYLATGTIGNIATYIFGPSYLIHLGASTAIFGMFGVYLFIILKRKSLIDQSSAQIIQTIIVIGLIMTFLQRNINIWGHLFGFIGGFGIAPLILNHVKPFSPVRNKRKRNRRKEEDETNVFDYREVNFDPNRWQKRHFPWKKILTYVFWVFILLLVILGVFGRF